MLKNQHGAPQKVGRRHRLVPALLVVATVLFGIVVAEKENIVYAQTTNTAGIVALVDNNQGGNNQGGNNQGDNNQGDNNQGDNNQGDNNQGDNSQGGSGNKGGDDHDPGHNQLPEVPYAAIIPAVLLAGLFLIRRFNTREQ